MSTTTNSPHMDGGPGEFTAGKTKVTLTGVTETLLIPLVGRALDASAQSPILGDPYARGVMEKLDYDFSKLPVPTHGAGVSLRTRFYDRWTASFLSKHPRATVLHLACGLDSRNRRVEWKSPDVRWIDVDLPEVVALRCQVLPTSLPGQDYQLVGADVIDDAWLERIPTDRPVLVVMEGLLSYLKPEDGKRLLERLVEKLKEGELHFECMNATALLASQKDKKSAVKQTGAEFQWVVDNLKDLEEIHPQLQMLEAVRYVEAPGVEEFPLVTRIAHYMMSWVPSFRDSVRFVRFGFSGEDKGESS